MQIHHDFSLMPVIANSHSHDNQRKLSITILNNKASTLRPTPIWKPLMENPL